MWTRHASRTGHARSAVTRWLAAGVLLALATGGGARAARAREPVRVVATLPHIAGICRELGGDRVVVTSLSDGRTDPHYVVPTPGLMAKASEAQLFVEIGAGLELWTERVLQGARNPRIVPGRPGHVYAYQGVAMLDVPALVSRSQGDMHPQGNPHIWFDPYNAIIMARNIARGLERVDPAGKEEYAQRLEAFERHVARAYFGERLIALLGERLLWRLQRSGKLFDFLAQRRYKGKPLSAYAGGWLGRMWPRRGIRLVSFHLVWSYLARAFDLEVIGQLEPKPGIPPTPGHLAELEALARERGLDLGGAAPYYDFAKARAFAARLDVPAIELPTEPPRADGSWFELMDAITERIVRAGEESGHGR